ncbi:MAG: aldo/keto reductase [Synechococcaceae cyanobacterium]
MPSATAGSLPPIGVGTWAWGNALLWGYEPSQDPGLEATFERCLDRGLTFFDTADSYGTGRFNGRSESLLGRFVAAAARPPATLTIATKLAPFPWRLGRGGFRRAFAASWERLGGRLDRVQLHWSTARYAPWQEAGLLDGLADLILAGDVAQVGVSNMGPQRLRWAHARLAGRGVELRSLQVQLSLLAPQALAPGGVAEVCRELGIELIAYSPLALGLLSRSPGSLAAPPPGLRGLLFRRLWPAAQPLLEAMEAMAGGRPGGMAAVALNWCRAHGAMPIPGLRSVGQVEAAAAACGWQLDSREWQQLDSLAWSCRQRMPANPFQSA